MKPVIFTLFLLLTLCTQAQVTTITYTTEAAKNLRPLTSKGLSNEYRITAPNINHLKQIEQEEIKREGDKGFKFAHAIDIRLNPLRYGRWTTTGDWSYWTGKLIAPGATCLSINFSKFNLPTHAEIYISNGDRTMITGPVTSSENNAAGVWGSAIYKGSELLVEIKVPTASKHQLQLEVQSIAYGYKNIFIEKDFGESGGCNINVLCALGNGWASERNAVSVLLNGNSTRFCSGSLIANACYTDIPYYLTAEHCFSDGNYANWKFLFQYWSPQCSPNQNGSTSVLFNGSQLRASNVASDFRLLQLNQTPASNSGLHYAGWSRNTTGITTLTGIHHPSGDVMKISQVNATPAKSALNNVAGTGTNFWLMNWGNTANGITEGGSSGSPLFDQNHRIIGQLTGGYSACNSSDLRDWYGAFDASWTGDGTNSSRLSNWLDPSNFNVTTTNTTNISSLNPTTASLSITGDNFICSGSKTYTANNVPAGSTIVWSSSNGYMTVSGSGTTATVTMNPVAHGPATLTATAVVNGCVVSNVATKVISVGTPYAGFNIVAHPMSPTSCYEAGAINSLQATLAFGEGYTGMQWGYIYNNTDYPGSETWDTYTFIPDNPGTYEIYVRPTNSCGVGTPTSTRIIEVVSSCAGGWGLKVQTSPNPAKGTLYVTITEENIPATKSKGALTQLSLREVISGRLVKQWSMAGHQKQLSLSLQGVSKGNYLLTVQKGSHRQSKQVIVE